MRSLCVYLPVSGLTARPLLVKTLSLQRFLSASKQFSFASNLCHCSQHIMCFHPANSWNTFLLLLRMIAQIGWALSSTLDFFRTPLEGRSFLVWQTIHQMIRQPIVQSTLQSRPNFPSRHTVTDLRLPTQTTRKAGHQVILLQFTCQL